MDSIIHCNANQHKRQNYVTDLSDNNFENNFDVIITNINIEGDHINSGYIYNDIDD